jgi:phage terminase large subunit
MPSINLKLKKSLFNDVYLPHLTDYSKRYEIYFGGAGSGKSVFIAQKLLVKACKRKRKILVIRKFGTTLRDSVFQLIIDLLKKWKLYEYCTINQTTYTITLPNESVFLFKGLDDSEKIKSITDITDIWCEEATELTEDDYTQLDLRLRAMVDDLQLFCSFNPVSKANWVYKKWFDPKLAVYDALETMILRTTYKDNRFLPKAYVKALEEKEKSNPLYYKIYALGEFAVAEGLVITNWTKEDFNPMELAQKFEHRVGMDLGFVDPSAVIETLYDRDNKTIYVFAEFYKKGCQLSELAQAIFDMGLRKVKIMVDAAEPRSREYFRNKGINAQPCIKGNDSVKAGLMFLQDHKIIVHPNCPNFIVELENFSYIKSKKTGEWTEDTTHEWSHAIDACRYAYSDVYTAKKAKTMSKTALGL